MRDGSLAEQAGLKIKSEKPALDDIEIPVDETVIEGDPEVKDEAQPEVVEDTEEVVEDDENSSKAKFSKEQQAVFDREQRKVLGELKAEKALREKLAGELESAKNLKDIMSDDTLLKAVENANLMPQIIKREEAELLVKADQASGAIRYWQSVIDDCIDSGERVFVDKKSGSEFSIKELRMHVNSLMESNSRVLTQANRIKASAAAKTEEIFALGMAAYLNKGKVTTAGSSVKKVIKPPLSPVAVSTQTRGGKKSLETIEKERASLSPMERRIAEIADELRSGKKASQ